MQEKVITYLLFVYLLLMVLFSQYQQQAINKFSNKQLLDDETQNDNKFAFLICSSLCFNQSKIQQIIQTKIVVNDEPVPAPSTDGVSTIKKFVGEIVGTFLLMFVGFGINANQQLIMTKTTDQGGVLVNTVGWGTALFIAVLSVNKISGAHLNPAISIGMSVAGNFQWVDVPLYIAGQCIGVMLSCVFVWLLYYPHFGLIERLLMRFQHNNQTQIHNNDKQQNVSFKTTKYALQQRILRTFVTVSEMDNYVLHNLFQEVAATFTLQFSVLLLKKGQVDNSTTGHEIYPIQLGALGALPVCMIMMGCMLSLGGTTGPAMNPARDLMPRIFHSQFPFKGKCNSMWSYSWIPVLGPILGAIIGGALFRGLGENF